MVKECKVEQNLGAGEYEVVSMIAIAVEGLFLKIQKIAFMENLNDSIYRWNGFKRHFRAKTIHHVAPFWLKVGHCCIKKNSEKHILEPLDSYIRGRTGRWKLDMLLVYGTLVLFLLWVTLRH